MFPLASSALHSSYYLHAKTIKRNLPIAAKRWTSSLDFSRSIQINTQIKYNIQNNIWISKFI